MVKRRCTPFGPAESEKGLERHQPLAFSTRMPNHCPARTGNLFIALPVIQSEATPSRSITTWSM